MVWQAVMQVLQGGCPAHQALAKELNDLGTEPADSFV
jgi:hypothetical protein